MKKVFENSSGNVVVRTTNSCGIVEILHNGCVLAYWKTVDDGVELKFVGDRLINADLDDWSTTREMLIYGQKLAELVNESTPE